MTYIINIDNNTLFHCICIIWNIKDVITEWKMPEMEIFKIICAQRAKSTERLFSR